MKQYSIYDFDNYYKPQSKAFEGQHPPDVHINSPIMDDWYAEQIYYCIHGRSVRYKGGTLRLTGDHYWFLNFFPFEIPEFTRTGKPTGNFVTNFGFYCNVDDYIFKTLEEARKSHMNYALLGARGFGKSYIALSLLTKGYTLTDEKFHGIIATSSEGHGTEAWNKVQTVIRDLGKAHPFLKQAADSSNTRIIAEYEVKRDGKKEIMGSHNLIEKHLFGHRPGGLKGRRVDYMLWEEFGDWSDGPGNLQACYAATKDIYGIGKLRRAKNVLFTGTGGTIKSKQAKEMFANWEAYNLYPSYDFAKRGSGVFIPVHYKRAGFWEHTGNNDRVEAEKQVDETRKLVENNLVLLRKEIQENPKTIKEAFMIQGKNNFNQMYLADQRVKIEFGDSDNVVKPERGFLDWKKSENNSKIIGVTWRPHPEGPIHVIEKPIKSKDGKQFNDLYVSGVDSIDQGEEDSIQSGKGSKLGMLVKKRMQNGAYFSGGTNNLYVCMYNERSKDVRDNYENALKIAMWYNCKVNVEYTKIVIITYFKAQGHKHRLMKRPEIAMANVKEENKKSKLIGTQATTPVIDHQDEKVKEYIDDYYSQIWFLELLEQLQDYDRNDRTSFDLVVCMGLTELADEDLLGKIASVDKNLGIEDFKMFGYYIDDNGKKRYGELPAVNSEALKYKKMLAKHAQNEALPFSWYTSNGAGRFDSDLITEDTI